MLHEATRDRRRPGVAVGHRLHRQLQPGQARRSSARAGHSVHPSGAIPRYSRATLRQTHS